MCTVRGYFVHMYLEHIHNVNSILYIPIWKLSIEGQILCRYWEVCNEGRRSIDHHYSPSPTPISCMESRHIFSCPDWISIKFFSQSNKALGRDLNIFFSSEVNLQFITPPFTFSFSKILVFLIFVAYKKFNSIYYCC